MAHSSLPRLDEPSANTAILITWLIEQEGGPTAELAQMIFDQLLERASQPLQASIQQSCTKLCGYVHKAAKSGIPQIEDWAFREQTALNLFNFYMEWNEQDQHRSMRLVLDLLSLQISKNLDRTTGEKIKESILRSLVSIITRRSNRPLIKSCMSSLHHLLSKSVCDLDDLERIYRDEQPDVKELPNLTLWGRFIHELFTWLGLQHARTSAGKLIMTLFKSIRETAVLKPQDDAWKDFHIELWHQWLLENVAVSPDLLENVRLYILLPLFRNDRGGALELLKVISLSEPSKSEYGAGDTAALLDLAALDIGKQEGLIEEQGVASAKATSIPLDGEVMRRILSHTSPVIRASALSLLVSSVSLSKPFSQSTIDLLKKYLPMYHSDTDPRLRNDVLSHSRVMTKRLKGSLAVLRRNLNEGRAPPTGSRSRDQKAAEDVENGSGSRDKQSSQKLTPSDIPMKQQLAQQDEFLQWYLSFLRGELAPTASYQRHIMALRATMALLSLPKNLAGPRGILDMEIGSEVFQDYAHIRGILDCIVDPFDDVREMAAAIMMLAPPDLISSPSFRHGDTRLSLADVLATFCERADRIASLTARADHADGVARSKGIVCSCANGFNSKMSLVTETLQQLESKIALAESDLGRAAIEHPVHGDFAALRYIWEVIIKSEYSQTELEVLSGIQMRIVDACQSIWKLVQHVLCDDSPEGHLPEELEDIEGLDTKDLLSYSFRAVHESSNTLRTIISTLRGIRTQGVVLPSADVFRTVGALSFEQMATLRHRGAFSRISQTFTTCCQLADDPVISPCNSREETLLMGWYKGTLDCIYSQASTTRRSAGIPSLMASILIANTSNPSFEDVMDKLASIAQEPARIAETDGSNLPQVHALNCLRDVFRSSLLNKRAEPHLGEMLQLAADSLRSEVWAIRNCGLLLLRSLIDCLFGTESKTDIDSGWDGRTMRLSYLRYPGLPAVLLSLLKAGQHATDVESQQAAAQSVFPALDIIRRAGPPEEARDELYSCIVKYLGSHLWHVRDMAARTVCSFLINQDWVTAIVGLLEGSRQSSNSLHGALLATKEMVMRVRLVDDGQGHNDVTRLHAKLEEILPSAATRELCPENQAAYLSVTNLISECDVAVNSATTNMRTTRRALIDETKPPSALLHLQAIMSALQSHANENDIIALQSTWETCVKIDIDTAAAMLRAIPNQWPHLSEDKSTAVNLYNFYISACLVSDSPDIRVPALANLTGMIEQMLTADGEISQLGGQLLELWNVLQKGPMNPALSQAIIRVSGPIMAVLVSREHPAPFSSTPQQIISSWCEMISDAGHADNPFDTRYAAAQAMRSYATAQASANLLHTVTDSFALALDDALNDDDDEVRDEAAATVSTVLRQPFAPLAAADAWLQWMVTSEFHHSPKFRTAVVGRMIGSQVAASADTGDMTTLVPAETQLRSALKFDDALFVIEEQNLFIDEVRETKRWATIYKSFPPQYHQASDTASDSLKKWTEDGLLFLIKLTGEESVDGPLGWTSKPEVYAICARVLLSAAAVVNTTGDKELVAMVKEFDTVGRQVGMHGGLLAMANI